MKKVEILATTKLPTTHGVFDFSVFKYIPTSQEHILITKGNINDSTDLLLRVHSSCITSEIFGSLKCDCQSQLDHALELLSKSKKGAIIYLFQEGRGIGLANKIKAYHLQEKGLNTIEANLELGFRIDERDFQPATDLLSHFGVKSVQLISNNPDKLSFLEKSGISITKRIPSPTLLTSHNKNYLLTKQKHLRHLIETNFDKS